MEIQLDKDNEMVGIEIDTEKDRCSYPECDNLPVVATIFKDKIKGLVVDKIHYWCDIHYRELRLRSVYNKKVKQKGGLNSSKD